MRLPRRRFEQGCRVAAFALLGWLIGTSFFPATPHATQVATSADIAGRLVAWSRAPNTVPLHGELSVTPESWVVDWLAALRHSGHVVTWSGSPPAAAISAEAVADPHGGTRIDLAAPVGAKVVVSDAASVIDSVTVRRLGARVVTPSLVGDATAVADGQSFTAIPPDSSPVRAVVVLGDAGWEGKFIASALAERGWPVVGRFFVAPKVDVTQGATDALVLDTSRVSAVIAVDTSAARYSEALTRYVQSGGGLVLAGPSSLAPPLAALSAGALGARLEPAVEPTDTISLGSTGYYPIAAMKPDGIVLERRTNGVAVAARRVGAGRVLQVGYDDSWRWRMAGTAGSEAAHRAWWASVVASVAYVPASTTPAASMVEASAPLAWMVDRLGPARASSAAGLHGRLDRRLFMILIMILLLAEWTSRRLRGLR